jgi:hypothetical protein
LWFGVVGKGVYDRGEVGIGIGRGRGGRGEERGGLLAFSLPISGVAVLEIGGDGWEAVFAEYGMVLVELGEAKKWWWEGVEVGTGTGRPRGT